MYIAPMGSLFLIFEVLEKCWCEALLSRLCEDSDLAAAGGKSGSWCTVKVRTASEGQK